MLLKYTPVTHKEKLEQIQKFFPISTLSLEQNKALQEALIKIIPFEPTSQEDLLNCTLLFGLKAAASPRSENVLTGACDLANLLLALAEKSLKDTPPQDSLQTTQDSLQSCLDFFKSTIKPILHQRASRQTELDSDRFYEAINTISKLDEVQKALKENVTEKRGEILSEIQRQQEHNSKIRYVCWEFAIDKSKYTQWTKVMQDLKDLYIKKARRYESIEKYRPKGGDLIRINPNYGGKPSMEQILEQEIKQKIKQKIYPTFWQPGI